MTFENITKNAVLNAGGRLVDPGKKISMDVEYYATHKNFVDAYVENKKAKITGLDEYKDFIENGGKKDEPKDEDKTDLMAEVIEEEAEATKEPEKEPEKPTKAEEEKEEEKPAPKKTSRRKRAAAKTEEN
jgi:hypothetical protein